ncbi:hypothetical protein [Lactobacillus delbrueckii]|nr:hypothetical protein [Lactobacillus delbrueckii]
MRKLTKSVVTALSLATATLSVIPQAAAPAEAARFIQLKPAF